MKNLITKSLFIFTIILLYVPEIFAQAGVGKLSGKVVDAETREPLVGANVILIDTYLGAATDINGEYFVLNITPGTYNVKISYVGYAAKTIQEVRIVAGITQELNVELSTDFTLPTIEVQGKKLFEEKSTNTVKVIDASQIDRLPVKGVQNIASLQAGVVTLEGSGGVAGNASINIRGGRGSEVLYIVDGVPQNTLYGRTSSTQVSNIAIDQISFQVGGYEAKYGQAQSGIVNVTTKSGSSTYNFLADAVTSTYLDNYGYNEYSASLGGPIIPGNAKHTFFFSGERGWFKDANPSAITLEFPSVDKSWDYRPNVPASVWRWNARTNHVFGDFSVRFGFLGNSRVSNVYSHYGAKNAYDFYDKFNTSNYSLSGRISQTVSSSSFWNLNVGYKLYKYKRYNPAFEDNLMAYGDSTIWANQLGVTLLGDGRRVAATDEVGIFRPYGYSFGFYQKRQEEAFNADFDFTAQIQNHLFEFGGGLSYSLVREFQGYPYLLKGIDDDPSLTAEQNYIKKFEDITPLVFGYDVTGNTETTTSEANELLRPRTPLLAYAYIQDRYELSDLVINIGIRMDYFDVKSYKFKDPMLPFTGGNNPNDFDINDFDIKKPELKFSPRIGIGFPVTENTVFHAQFGKFIQLPELFDLYFGPFDHASWLTYAPQSGFNGDLMTEETVQYEIGFRQMFGNNAALNMTAFYKNIKGLVNVQNNFFQRSSGGELITAIYPQNADFGTTKGFAFSLDVMNMSYFSVSAQYTYSVAEGTGSSTSSSQTAIFRNNDNEAPKVIAPLDFDQRHTATVNVDFYVPEGQLGLLERFNVNMLFSINSGRPYTPLDYWDIVTGNDGGPSTTGYVNSRYGPGSFRMDLRVEKTFNIGPVLLSPYLWVQNVFDADNVLAVYRSTGDPYTTGFLNTEKGKARIATGGEAYAQDYKSLERNPGNFGIPRQIRLGVKVNFSNITF
ncbi:MAG: TonB-dependent receptor [Ignavibacteriales bacterium]|jgi:hypothetical protein|nr:TonB-dependent receptor [Ignavibacteriaceae bacterium]NLH61911.1 TonB-dependent receptor [Ignavibacteriales bacterium]HOJ17886.1 TonB-dependent receptor [Ignavibacteriaceae bacterium]HPO56318.1 TonB-dependent receptor [Ignavibacteriaceae bacterium]